MKLTRSMTRRAAAFGALACFACSTAYGQLRPEHDSGHAPEQLSGQVPGQVPGHVVGATGSPVPLPVAFADEEIAAWTDRLNQHVKPRAFFEQLQGDAFQRGVVYVQFRPSTGIGDMLAVNAAAGVTNVLWQSQIIPGLMQVAVVQEREHEAILTYLDHDAVMYAEPDYLATPTETVPNDTLYDFLWGMENIRAPEAWDFHTGNTNALIAIVDSGILLNHMDLNVAAELGWDYFNNDSNGNDFDNCCGNPCNYHGTHVAGTAAALGNNGFGVVGVNWGARVVPIKACGPVEDGDDFGCSCMNTAQALERALLVGARVSNHSYGGPTFKQSEYNMIVAAQSHGHIVVTSAGNSATNNDASPQYPASYDLWNIIAVANINSSNALASNSCWGAESVDLGAPGVGIASTMGPSDDFGNKSGTSMASPHVAGAVALLQAANNNDIPPLWILDRLLDSTAPTPALTGLTVTGGRLDLRGSLDVYGDFDGTGGGSGSKFRPYTSFDDCLFWTPAGFELHLFPSSTGWTGIIDDPITIKTVGGSASIGTP